MEEPKEVKVQIMEQETETTNTLDEQQRNTTNNPTTQLKNYKWWIKISIYIIFLLAGQTIATILGRLYFEKGGNSKWMATLVQTAGFPLILFFYINPAAPDNQISTQQKPHPLSNLHLVLMYTVFGIFLAANNLLYSLGLLYLPVSTYTLICASQLGFNALFSFFLNAQKLTPFIINSVFLLTISSALLMFETDSTESTQIPKGKYIIGFLCTLGASAGYGLMLSMTQFCFIKVFKEESFKMVLDMIFYPAIPATLAVVLGLFVSAEWKGLRGEMEGFELGNVGYVMTLVWTAICWQVFNIGCVGLIFEVSSLFSNVIGTLGFPIVPVLAVFVFNDKMDGLKIVSMVLALWGFVSYAYQHYLDDHSSKNDDHVEQIPPLSSTDPKCNE